MIYYQNGIQNTQKNAEKDTKIIEDLIGRNVGIINNKTQGLENDVNEYFRKGLTTMDALNAKVYEDIAKNGDDKNLIILHSAGNEDAYKALQVLVLENRSLDNKIDFISVASPRSKNDLKKATSKVNSNLFNQYNNWKDPITWGSIGMAAPIVGIGAVTGIGVGIKIGTAVGAGAISLLPELGPYAIPVATVVGFSAGAAAGAAELGAIKLNHGIDRYLNSNYKNLKTDLHTWTEKNPSTDSEK